MPSLLAKCLAVQKIHPGQTFTEIFTIAVTDLEHSNPVVSQDSPAQSFSVEKISISEDIVERVLFR